MPPPGTRPGTGRETRVTCTTTKDTPPAEALSVERPTDPFHSANLVRETFEPVMRLRCPSILPCPRHQAIARIMPDDHQATAHLGLSCLLSTLLSLLSRPSCPEIPTPPTPVSRGRGGTKAGHRTRTPVMSWFPFNSSLSTRTAQRWPSPPVKALDRRGILDRPASPDRLGSTDLPGPTGLSGPAGPAGRPDCFARNRASRAASAIRINSANRCFCNSVNTSSTSCRSWAFNASSWRVNVANRSRYRAWIE
jgi:hypothetical protein